MTTYTIDRELNVTAFETLKAADATGQLTFQTVEDMGAALTVLNIKPVDLWNSLPGLVPVTKFMNREAGLKRIWKQLQGLTPTPAGALEGFIAEQAQILPSDVAPRKTKKAAKAAKKAAPAKKEAKPATSDAGSKQAQAVALLSRSNGATLNELMATFGWQAHTVRGFIAGACRVKLGLNIESWKTADGERAYRVAYNG